MVLSADVRDLSGRMLLKSGTEIEQKHLKVLRTWGILGVEVVGEGSLEAAEQDIAMRDLPPEILADIDAEIERRFIGVDTSHPVMAALVELVKVDLARTSLSAGREG
jgi:hypothetical protein